MGAIREYKKEDNSITYHAEVRLKGYPIQRESFRTKTLAKKWIQDTSLRLGTEGIFEQQNRKNIRLKI